MKASSSPSFKHYIPDVRNVGFGEEAARRLEKIFQQLLDNTAQLNVNSAVRTFTTAASAGGGATETLACTGVLTTDTIVGAVQTTKGANGTAVVTANIGSSADEIDAEWTGDPGAGAILQVLVLRPTATTT